MSNLNYFEFLIDPITLLMVNISCNVQLMKVQLYECDVGPLLLSLGKSLEHSWKFKIGVGPQWCQPVEKQHYNEYYVSAESFI